MTDTVVPSVPRTAVTDPAAALLAVLGLIDVALTGVIGQSAAPPLIVSLVLAASGLITLASLMPARRGSATAVRAIVATRIISAGLAAPAFLLGAPAWVMIVEGSSSPPRLSRWSCCAARADRSREHGTAG